MDSPERGGVHYEIWKDGYRIEWVGKGKEKARKASGVHYTRVYFLSLQCLLVSAKKGRIFRYIRLSTMQG
jgi:hypothetical protein